MLKKPSYEELEKQVERLQAEVADLRTAAQRYHDSEEKFSKVFQNCPVWVVVSTFRDGRYIEVNNSFLEITGYTRDQVIGRTSTELGLWDNPEDRLTIIEEINKHGSIQNYEVLRRDRSNNPVHMLFFGEKILVNGEEYLVSTSIDITRQKAIEQALKESKQNLEASVAARTKDLAETNAALKREIERRIQVEAELRESEQKYRTLVDNSLVGIYRTDLNGNILYSNDALPKMFGFDSRDEFIADGVLIRYKHQADRTRLIEKLQHNGKVDSLEVDLITKTGATVTALLCATLEEDQISGVLIDITDMKKAEMKLRESEERFRLLFDEANEAILVHDLAGRFHVFNSKACEFLGYSKEELIELTVADIDPDFVAREAEGDFWSDLPIVFEGQHQRKDGTMLSVEVRLSMILLHGQHFVLALVNDITARKRAEAQQRFQAQIMNQIHDSVIAVDMDGMITNWNKGSERLFHYKDHDIIGKHISTLYPEYSHGLLQNDIMPTLLAQGNHELETTLLRKGSEEFTAIVSLSVLRDKFGELTGMIGYTLDITERKQIQQALADSERRLADIIEFLPDPTWVIDIEGRVIAWNKAVERMTGVKKKDILGKGDYAHAIPFYGEPRPTLVNLVLHRDEQWEHKYLSIKEENGMLLAGDSFHPIMGKGGRYLSATAAKIRDAQGKVVGAIQSIRDITAAKLSEQERERLIKELQDALAEVRTLSGFLPICSSCKKIRDDTGYWNQIEAYISKHTQADFSHSLCPKCAKKLYPDLEIKLD